MTKKCPYCGNEMVEGTTEYMGVESVMLQCPNHKGIWYVRSEEDFLKIRDRAWVAMKDRENLK